MTTRPHQLQARMSQALDEVLARRGRPAEAQRYPGAWARYVNEICPRLGLTPSADRFRAAVARHELSRTLAAADRTQTARLMAALDRRVATVDRALLASLDVAAERARKRRLRPAGPIRVF